MRVCPESTRRNPDVAAMLHIPRVTYHGGLSFVAESGVHGRLVLDDEALTLDRVQNEGYTRDLPSLELCRTGAIGAIEVTSEQVAKSKLGAALVFGVLGGVTAKASKDRGTLIVYMKAGDAGYFTVDRQSAASLLGLISPWMRDRGIAQGSPQVTKSEPIAPKLVADELTKLAQLKESGVISEGEFVALKAKLIEDHLVSIT
jgi:hypothetical protein